jgi:hypothetical protein
LESTTIGGWLERAQRSLAQWANESEKELQAALSDLLSKEEVSDSDFVTIINLSVIASGGDYDLLAHKTHLAFAKVRDWRSGKDLPDPELRAHIIGLCVAGRVSIPISVEQMVRFTKVGQIEVPVTVPSTPSDPPLLFDPQMKISELELPIRSFKALKNDDINYVGQLVTLTDRELLRIPNFGRMSLYEVRTVLISIGAELGMKHPLLDEFLKEHPFKKY